VVVAKVSDEMNLARPKSETFITRVAGFEDEYKRFSGFIVILGRGAYLDVPVDDVERVAVVDGVDDGPDRLGRLLLAVVLLLENHVEQLKTCGCKKIPLRRS